ncbi:family 16 glycosylhydrolase [bacterium]|nr:family 16 glycosylhydrolase [bacterium]
MFSVITLGLAALFLSATSAEPPSGVPEGYQLVWADEFDGDELNWEEWAPRDTKRNVRETEEKLNITLARNLKVANGNLEVHCKIEEYDGYPTTAGGAITKRRYRYGYYESSVKCDGGPGWHEAFWAYVWGGIYPKEDFGATPHFEIDALEHYADYGPHQFTYGLIEWYPTKGSINREYLTVEEDLVAEFHTYGFEYAPDYFNFFFDGRLLETVDISDVGHNDFVLWLSCIATQLPEKDGVALFDYLRCYAIDLESPEYEGRKEEFVGKIKTGAYEDVKSAGIDMWIQAEDFARTGGWEQRRDGRDRVLLGHTEGKKGALSWSEQTARTMIIVRNPGRHRLWVRSKDYADDDPGIRHLKTAVNGKMSETTFGAHGEDGYAWQDGGIFDLPNGLTTIELIDSSRFYARVDKLFLTTDLDFVPAGLGNKGNVEHWMEEDRIQSARPAE